MYHLVFDAKIDDKASQSSKYTACEAFENFRGARYASDFWSHVEQLSTVEMPKSQHATHSMQLD